MTTTIRSNTRQGEARQDAKQTGSKMQKEKALEPFLFSGFRTVQIDFRLKPDMREHSMNNGTRKVRWLE